MSQSALYMKCRPQAVDAWPIAEKYNRVFIGYPVWKPDTLDENITTGLKRYFYDISIETPSSKVWHLLKRGYRSMVTRHSNLIMKIKIGDFVIIPRPGDGNCHISKIISGFEVSDSPDWAEDYLELRRDNKL
ncbi:MAG: hypothetical protein GWP19_10355, partial [Planctomycetia bacterium]|nr:hypothetical protein [Planctomycetia bacterium]